MNRRHDRLREMIARRSELTPQEETQLQEHLWHCPECRELDQSYAEQAKLLRSLPLADPPPALRAGVLGAIAEGVERVSGRSRRLLAFFVPAAAALIALAVVLGYVTRPHGSGPSALNHPSSPTAGLSSPAPVAARATPHRPKSRRKQRGHATATPSPQSGIQPSSSSVAQNVATTTPVATSGSQRTPVPTARPSPTTGGRTSPRPAPTHGRKASTPAPTIQVTHPQATATLPEPSPPTPAPTPQPTPQPSFTGIAAVTKIATPTPTLGSARPGPVTPTSTPAPTP